MKVFTQIYVLQRAGAPTRETNLLGTLIYSYGGEYSKAGALATIMLVITLGMTGFYVRQMLKEDEL
jgi:N,N'-diacetylchitobiose transport system permease protein